MLELARGLSPRSLAAIAELEQRTINADGGRLKLEWHVLNTRSSNDVEDVLWWDGDTLVGFLGMYSFGSSVEFAGMVDPAARRRGIGSAMLGAASQISRDRGVGQALLVTPRGPAGGSEFALHHGARLEHSEYAMVLLGEPAAGPSDPLVTLRTATADDGPDLARILESAFGWAPPDASMWQSSDTARTLVIELSGTSVGTVRVTRDDHGGAVYGFAVDPAWQGRGIGRDVLRRVCRQLRADGAEQVRLEVELQNEHALGLYTSIGFTQVTTEDYYALQLS